MNLRIAIFILLFGFLFSGISSLNLEISTSSFPKSYFDNGRMKFCLYLPVIPMTQNFSSKLEIKFEEDSIDIDDIIIYFFDNDIPNIFSIDDDDFSTIVIQNVTEYWDLDQVRETGAFYGKMIHDFVPYEMVLSFYIDEKETIYTNINENSYSCVGYLTFGDPHRSMPLILHLVIIFGITLVVISFFCSALFWFLKRRRKRQKNIVLRHNQYHFMNNYNLT